GPGAEIVAGHENAGVAELRLVEHEVGILAGVVAPARAHEQQRLVIGLEAAHRLHRRDLVGVDVVLDERDGDAGMGRERLHQACPDMSCRTSAMRPATAVAAAVAGLTRCVRTFGPWRCSKLRWWWKRNALPARRDRHCRRRTWSSRIRSTRTR